MPSLISGLTKGYFPSKNQSSFVYVKEKDLQKPTRTDPNINETKKAPKKIISKTAVKTKHVFPFESNLNTPQTIQESNFEIASIEQMKVKEYRSPLSQERKRNL